MNEKQSKKPESSSVVKSAAETKTVEDKAAEAKAAVTKAVEAKAEDVKAAVTKAGAKAEEVKAAVTKAVESKVEEKPEVQKEDIKEEKAKRAAAPKKRAGRKPTEKKAESEAEVFVEFEGIQSSLADVKKRVVDAFVSEGHRPSTIKSLRVYLKPVDYAAYYVINDKFMGRVDLF